MKINLCGLVSRQYVWENMKIYLASPNTGTIKGYLDNVKIYVAGEFPCGATGKGEQAMKLYLSESGGAHKAYTEPAGLLKKKVCILESFYYAKEWMIPYIRDYWDFMLDSGAFTFMQNATIEINWDKYTEQYAAFIKANNVSYYFELDIDSIVGYKEVKRLRRKLESLTGTECIPVWHKSRGKADWLKTVKDYTYVAIGGIVNKEIKGNQYPIFTWLLKEARKEKCKVHGLGFTSMAGMKKYHFYSVDSTAWIYGNRGGFLYKFTGNNIIKIDKPAGTRMKPRKTAIHNFNEWVKFQKYAERCL